jgi:hypothetical protein
VTYHLVLVENPTVNAFALPGGHIYMTTGMFDNLQTEAEAAAVIAHEMAHVDLRHCIERYQYEIQARKLGGEPLAAMASIGANLMLLGYQDEQELEADRWGMQIAAKAGYHPQAMQRLFARMLQRHGTNSTAPKTIPGELAHSALDALRDIFASHPDMTQRMENLERAITETGLDPKSTPYYVGARNRLELCFRKETEYPGELVQERIFPESVARQRGPILLDFSFEKIESVYNPPMPRCPPGWKGRQDQSKTLVEILIGIDGVPQRAVAKDGPPPLRSSAERWAMQCRFKPVLLAGDAIRVRSKFDLYFY